MYWSETRITGLFDTLILEIVLNPPEHNLQTLFWFWCVWLWCGQFYQPLSGLIHRGLQTTAKGTRGIGENYPTRNPLQWRHNMRDGVSNHRRLGCLLNRLFRRRSKKHLSSASLAFVREIHRWPVNSPHKGPVTRIMFSCDEVIM